MTSIYARLHAKMSIPDGYHISEAKSRPLNNGTRAAAIHELRERGELRGYDDTEDLLDAIAKKLTKLHLVTRLIEITPPRAKKREPKDKAPPKIRSRADPEWADKKAKRLARKEKIIAEIIADPAVSSLKLARKHGVDESCVRRYKSQLRFEGKIA